MERVLVAMSGGVDSAVAAARLVAAGYRVEAAYLKVWMDEEGTGLGDCPWEEDLTAGRAVAAQLGIPLHVVGAVEAYRSRIVEYLVEGYRQGRTPNPDVFCNREIKFGVLGDWARERGFAAVATGHYARREVNAAGEPELWEGADPEKDQSYFLARIRPEQLAAARFPLGHSSKAQVRAEARELGLANAARKDSQGLCFLGKVRIQDFLGRFIEDRPGEIVTLEGRVVGRHRGLHRYTIGQRKGIGVPSNTDHEAFVVVGKDLPANRLRVAFDQPGTPGLWTTTATLEDVRWLGSDRPAGSVEIRVRYRDPRVTATITAQTDDRLALEFATPQRGLAPGQIGVIHAGAKVLGSGVFV